MTVVSDPSGYTLLALGLRDEIDGQVRTLLADLLPDRSMSASQGSDNN